MVWVICRRCKKRVKGVNPKITKVNNADSVDCFCPLCHTRIMAFKKRTKMKKEFKNYLDTLEKTNGGMI